MKVHTMISEGNVQSK